jgi:hypothetical protein
MTQEEEDRKAKDRARQERMSSRQGEELEAKSVDGTVASAASSRSRDTVAKDAARRPMSSATSVQPGAESVSMESPSTPSSRSRSKAGYAPSFADDDMAAGVEAPPLAAEVPKSPSGSMDSTGLEAPPTNSEEEDRKAKDRARQERMAPRQAEELEDASSCSSPRANIDAVAKNAARRPMSSATSVEAGAESVSMEAASFVAPPSNSSSARPGAESASPGALPLIRDRPKKDPSAVELQATLVDDEGEDQKLKRFVEEMEGRLQQQMQDIHQQQTQPQTQDLNRVIVIDADSPSSLEEGNRSKKRGIIVGVIVLVLAIGGGLAGFFLSQKDSNNEAPLALNPADAPIVPGNPTDMPIADLSYDPPSRADCIVMEGGKPLDVGQDVIVKDFVVQLDVTFSEQPGESFWVDWLQQRVQEIVVPDLVGCFDVPRKLGERDESYLPQVDRNLNEDSRYVVKFALIDAVLGTSCVEPSPFCRRVDVSLTLFLKGDENNFFLIDLIIDSLGRKSDDSLVQRLGLRQPFSSIGVEGVSAGALIEDNESTSLPTVFANCQDYPTWLDSGGDGCGWYSLFGCSGAGSYVNECNIDADAACCVCGGGLDPDQVEPECSLCTDYPTWSDFFGDGCGWYASNGCSTGDYVAGDFANECNIDADAACCVCDGGLQPGEDEPTCSSCTDFLWVDVYGDTCSSFYLLDSDCLGKITPMEQVVNNVCIFYFL